MDVIDRISYLNGAIIHNIHNNKINEDKYHDELNCFKIYPELYRWHQNYEYKWITINYGAHHIRVKNVLSISINQPENNYRRYLFQKRFFSHWNKL